jgi:hypothetical protein
MQGVTCAARSVTSVAADATSVRARRRRGSAEGSHVGVPLLHIETPRLNQSVSSAGLDAESCLVPDYGFVTSRRVDGPIQGTDLSLDLQNPHRQPRGV